MMMPGFPVMMRGPAGLPIITLTTGEFFYEDGSGFVGFSTGEFGSTSGQPMPDLTLNRLGDNYGTDYDPIGSSFQFYATFNAPPVLSAFNGVEVNGVRYALSGSWSQGAIPDVVSRNGPPLGLVSGTAHSIRFVA